MRQPSNVRCYLPKHEAAKLLAFLLEVRRIWPEAFNTTEDDNRELADKDRA